ncbi:OTU domain-containing protein [Chlamydia psittaci]|uniref:membrane protein n=1 Tax=Chlamydia psittaci TaxID=83554 RepID=UPI00027E1425|nr:membrane protein [Chlamydia psittaci]AFS25246.1 putative membrane protein [Chlamydia psittaci M56]
MSSSSFTPPSCPTPGRNNLYHLQVNPQDPLCIKALRLVAYVLLHIVTLGLLLLFHYYTRHTTPATTTPIIPVVPQAPSSQPPLPLLSRMPSVDSPAYPEASRRRAPLQPPQRPTTQAPVELPAATPHPTVITQPRQQPTVPPPATPTQLPQPKTKTLRPPQPEVPSLPPDQQPSTKSALDLPPTAPQPPVTTQPRQQPTVPPPAAPTQFPRPKTKTLRPPQVQQRPVLSGLPSLSEIIERIQSLGVLPQGVDQKSLEAMVHFNEQGLVPNNARLTITSAQILNPLFVATYPKSIRSTFHLTMQNLETVIRTGNAQDENTRVSHLLLSQLTHLNDNYYAVNVPGDGNCFYRSFHIGWMCSLMRSGDPQAFEKEAQRIIKLPFAQSSARNRLLTEQMITVLRHCQIYGNWKDLYDNVLLSPIHTPRAISYLRNLALHTLDEARLTNMGGEQNVRALILGQMIDGPEMLAEALRKIIQTEPSSPILQHIFRGNVLPITGAANQLELVLEFLSQMLLSNQKIQQLPPEKQQEERLFQTTLDELLSTVSATLTSGDLTEGNTIPIITSLPIEIQGHYQKFTQSLMRTRPGQQIPTPVTLLSFLLSHPSCATNNAVCHDFLTHAKTTLARIIGNNLDLTDALHWSGEVAETLNTKLQASWAQKQAGSLIEVALSLCDGLKSSNMIPQLGYTYRLIAKLMQSTPQSTPEAELRNTLDTILSHIQNNPNQVVSYTEVINSEIFKGLQLEASTNAKDKVYAEGIKMFFFLLQYPSLLTNRVTTNAAKKIMLLYQPHLQQALRNKLNTYRVLSLGGSIFGTFCWQPPACGDNVTTQTIESLLSFLCRDPSALSLCPNMRTKFFQIMDSGNAEQTTALLQDTRTACPLLWEEFICQLDTVGHRATPQRTSRPFSQSIPSDVLLYSFLHTNSQLLDGNTELAIRLKTYSTEQTIRMKTYITENLDTWTTLFWTNVDRLTTYNNLQRAFLFSLVRRNNPHPEAYQSFIHDLNTMDIRELMHTFNSVNTQAEDEHISAISSALGSLALCQYLGDASLTQTVRQLSALATTQGFFQTDYVPEQQAKIFVLRANNHYNCLLPKDAHDTSRVTNQGAAQNQP